MSDGGPAFPGVAQVRQGLGDAHTAWVESLTAGGMSMRDYFAAVALPLGWQIECERPTGPYSERMEPTYAGAAARAYHMADAMLAEREK